jgi:hypothetical protein
MSSRPDFEIITGHDFKPKEKVFVIDPNGYDLWEGIITSIKSNKLGIQYPAFPGEDEELEDTSRILTDTRVNRRIFNMQEAIRQTQLPPLDSSESEPFSDRSDDPDSEGREYAPARGLENPKKGKKPKKANKPKKDKVRPRPEGVRVSPRRSV